jgi:hypothetical protein
VVKTDQEWIKAAIEHDREGLINGIKWLYNCREAEVRDGDELIDAAIWIADPQRGHWLDADGIARVASALRAGDI